MLVCQATGAGRRAEHQFLNVPGAEGAYQDYTKPRANRTARTAVMDTDVQA